MKNEMKKRKVQLRKGVKNLLFLLVVFTQWRPALSSSFTIFENGLIHSINSNDIPGKRIKVQKNSVLLNTAPPTKYSLEQYLPPIGNQGDVGSCVGWASAYYGFTIIKRIENGSGTPAFSPWSVFNRYGNIYKTMPCSPGAEIDKCLAILQEKGCPTEKEYKIPYCAVDKSKTRYKERLYKFQRLQKKSVAQIKSSIAANCPVVMSIKIFDGGLGNSLNSQFLDSNGIIRMDFFRDKEYAAGLHAMCIVGYDDDMSGGAFKIVNSWGKEWGKNGFCWLRYSDLDALVSVYNMQPKPMSKNKQPAASSK
jgi:C1A family cysteine protease